MHTTQQLLNSNTPKQGPRPCHHALKSANWLHTGLWPAAVHAVGIVAVHCCLVKQSDNTACVSTDAQASAQATSTTAAKPAAVACCHSMQTSQGNTCIQGLSQPLPTNTPPGMQQQTQSRW